MCLGIYYVAGRLGMPFGTTSVVYAWHRAGVMMAGCVCLTLLGLLTGLETDPSKCADSMLRMVLFGAEVAIELANATVTIVRALM